MALVLPPFVLVTHGTSLSNGRLSADWVPRLLREIQLQAECKGPVRVHNMGHGGWTSADLLADAAKVAALNPTHVLAEGGAINDCVDFGAGPAISRLVHNQNNAARYALWTAANPAVDITVQTMSSVSALVATIRPALGDYYADELVQAAGLGFGYLDHYAGWPKPLDANLTNGQAAFKIAPTATYTPLPDGAVWNAADKSANLVLAADGLSISSIAAGVVSIRGATVLAAKEHFEFTWGAKTQGVGVVDAAASLAAGVGVDAHGVALFQNGNVYRNNNLQGASGLGALVAGDVIGVELDRPNNNLYFMKGATRSAAFDISTLNASVYAGASLFNAGDGGAAKFVTVGDGLHPIYTGAVDTYHYPSVLAWAKAKMAAFWP